MFFDSVENLLHISTGLFKEQGFEVDFTAVTVESFKEADPTMNGQNVLQTALDNIKK